MMIHSGGSIAIQVTHVTGKVVMMSAPNRVEAQRLIKAAEKVGAKAVVKRRGRSSPAAHTKPGPVTIITRH